MTDKNSNLSEFIDNFATVCVKITKSLTDS